MATERDLENQLGNKTFSIEIPQLLPTKKEEIGTLEKTSLFVPSDIIFNGKIDFQPSSFSSEVLVTRDVKGILTAIFKYGDVAARYGEGGLEEDPNRQQINIYTLVVCQGHLLWYQRAIEEKGNEVKVHGDVRLQGKFSVGFGGHKTKEDISLSREDLFLLRDLMPAIQPEIGTMLGLNRGFLSEVQEELGLGRDQIKKIHLLGGLHDKRINEPERKVQVGAVHTGIVAVLEIEPHATDRLTFRKSETANAWWVKFEQINSELAKRQSSLEGTDTWTEVVIKEFWPDYLNSAS